MNFRTATLVLLFVVTSVPSLWASYEGLKCHSCIHLQGIGDQCDCKKKPARRDCSAEVINGTGDRQVEIKTALKSGSAQGSAGFHKACILITGHDLINTRRFWYRGYALSKENSSTCETIIFDNMTGQYPHLFVESYCSCTKDYCNSQSGGEKLIHIGISYILMLTFLVTSGKRFWALFSGQ